MQIYCNRCGLASETDAQFCQGCGTSLQPAATLGLPVSKDSPHYAGFWIRVVASLIDFCLLLAVIFPVRMLLGSAVLLVGVQSEFPTHQTMIIRRVIRIAVGFAIAWAYKAGLESSMYQATLGKMAARLKVTDQEGQRISLARATTRYFSKYLSTAALGLGYVMVGLDEQKQGLHDRIAGTLVMYRNSANPQIHL